VLEQLRRLLEPEEVHTSYHLPLYESLIFLKRSFLLLTDCASDEMMYGLGVNGASKRRTSQELNQTPTSYGSVVIGLAPSSFNYPTLNTAFRILKAEPGEINTPLAPQTI